MVTTPSASLDVQDGGLGVAASTSRAVALAGISSSGSVATPLVTTDTTLIKSTFGQGPLVEVGCLLASAGITVSCTRVTGSVVGVVGSVTPVRVGSSDGTITVSGTPYDGYEAIVEITTDAVDTTAATGTFKYTLDGGDCYSGEVAIPSAIACTSITKTGTTPPTITVAGTPADTYQFQVDITTSGVNGVAKFKYSLDGGATWAASDVTVPTTPFTYVMGASGITITFANGTYTDDNLYVWDTESLYTLPDTGLVLHFVNHAAVLSFDDGDTHSFTCTAPGYSTADLATAGAAILANSQTWDFLFAIGEAADAAGAAAVASTLNTLLNTTAYAQHRYAWALMGCPDVSDTLLKAGFAAFTSTRVGVAAGFCNMCSAVKVGRYYKRSIAWAAAKRIATEAISRDIGRVKSGPLPDIALRSSGLSGIYRDERITPTLDSVGFITATTLIGKTGYYITQGNIMAGDGSDYGLIQLRQVMDAASSVVYPALVEFMNDDVVTAADGTIYPPEANRMDTDLTEKLKDALVSTSPQHASAVKAWVRRDLNIQTTRTLVAKFRIQPKGYFKTITGEIAYSATLED